MKIFFHLSIFVAYFHFIVASFSKEPQVYAVARESEEESQEPQDCVVKREPEELQKYAVEREAEEPQSYGAAITFAFHEYRANANKDTYCVFRNKACEFFIQSPFECLELLDLYRDDWIFQLAFWRAIKGPDRYLDLTASTPPYYPKVVAWIIKVIRRILLDCCCASISKFKIDLEIVSRLITEAEGTLLRLDSLGIGLLHIASGTVLRDILNYRIEICKYLARKIDTDFPAEKINYLSLFSTFDEIIRTLTNHFHSNTTTFYLPKLCALLHIYLHHIYKNHCTAVFDTNDKHKALVIYLAMKFGPGTKRPRIEYCSSVLMLHLQVLYETFSLSLDHIENFMKKCNPQYYRYLLGEASNFSELAKLLNDNFNQLHPWGSWEIRALAELERFISQNGLKVPERRDSLKEIELDSGKEPEEPEAVEWEPVELRAVEEVPELQAVEREPEASRNYAVASSSSESDSEKLHTVARVPKPPQNCPQENSSLAPSSFIIGSLVIFGLVCIALRRKL